MEFLAYVLAAGVAGFVFGCNFKEWIHRSLLRSKVDDTALFIDGQPCYVISAKRYGELEGWRS